MASKRKAAKKAASRKKPAAPQSQGGVRDDRDDKGRFRKGVSGNPGGMPRGRSITSELRSKLEEDDGKIRKGIIQRLVMMAVEGDFQAIKLIVERTDFGWGMQMPKATTLAGVTRGMSDLAEKVAEGDVPLEQAKALAAVLRELREAIVSSELEDRIKALEKGGG